MQSQTCIFGGNFQKKHIFWKDFLQASKLGRGRELTKERPYIFANSVNDDDNDKEPNDAFSMCPMGNKYAKAMKKTKSKARSTGVGTDSLKKHGDAFDEDDDDNGPTCSFILGDITSVMQVVLAEVQQWMHMEMMHQQQMQSRLMMMMGNMSEEERK